MNILLANLLYLSLVRKSWQRTVPELEKTDITYKMVQ